MLCDTLKVPETDLLCGCGPRTPLLLNIVCHKDSKQEREPSVLDDIQTPEDIRVSLRRVCIIFVTISTHHVHVLFTCFKKAFDFIPKYVIPPDSIEEATQDDLSTSLTMPFDSAIAGSLFERRFQEVHCSNHLNSFNPPDNQQSNVRASLLTT